MIRTILAAAVYLLVVTAQADDDLQAWIDEEVSSGKTLAISAASLSDDELTYYAGGKLSPDGEAVPDQHSQYEIGSITKSFTDLLLAEMVERGAVSYDTTIADILGDEVVFANQDLPKITLLQLATHTSGLPRMPPDFAPTDPLDPFKGYDDAALYKSLGITRDKQPLGNFYAYSNLGVGLLGHLLGRVHGAGYEAALEELVLEPLGLGRTGFERAAGSVTAFSSGEVVKDWSIDSLAGAGSLRSTTADLMRLARIQLGLVDNPLAHDLADDREIMTEAGAFDVTRVWHVGGSPEGDFFWHNGGTGGFDSFFGFRPSTGDAVAIIASGDSNPTARGLEWLGWDGPRQRDETIDESLFGQYDLTPSFGVGVYELGGLLVTQATGQSPFALHAMEDDWYALDLVDASVRFIREDGEVVALEMAQNGVIQRASKSANEAAALSSAQEEIEMATGELAAYVGEYAISAAAKFTIKLEGDGLQAMLTGQPFFPIYPKGDDIFFYKIVDAELHFERDDDGEVDALVLHQGAIVQRAEKVN